MTGGDAMAEGTTPAGARPISILVVDDDPDSADSLALLFEHWNHAVAVAYDGAGAIEAYRAHAPDLVLIDIGLPDMDGYDVARALRREPHRATLVALTGFGADEDREAAREAGFDQHLVKPVDLTRLRELAGGR